MWQLQPGILTYKPLVQNVCTDTHTHVQESNSTAIHMQVQGSGDREDEGKTAHSAASSNASGCAAQQRLHWRPESGSD